MASLYETALELAVESFPDDGNPPLPFAMAATNGQLQHFTIVTTNSFKAMHLGRNILRQQAPNADEYAIVVDTFIRVGGERSDALSVEFGNREGGRVIAQCYRRDGTTITKLGEPLDVERRPSALVLVDPNELDWGSITPDFFNDKLNKAAHAVNHLLRSADDIERTSRFLRARARRFSIALPPGATQLAFVDDRGQSNVVKADLVQALAGVMDVQFASEKN